MDATDVRDARVTCYNVGVTGTTTRKFVAKPAAMAVGLIEALADAAALHLAPLPVTRVAHVAAAIERMVVIRPQVIVVMTNADKMEVLRERAEDVGAELAELAPGMDELQIKAALINAKYRSDRRF